MSNNNYIRKGFEEKSKAFRSSGHEMRLATLSDVGYIDGHKVVPSKVEKERAAKRQRSNWRNELRNDYGY